MKKYQEPNYNIDGVDMNIYTVKRDDDIEYYADKLDYLKESHRDKYNMIAAIIEMSVLIQHDVIDFNYNSTKNSLINEISRMKNKMNIRHLHNVVRALNK